MLRIRKEQKMPRNSGSAPGMNRESSQRILKPILCTAELSTLMELRGIEGKEEIDRRYGGLDGLHARLQTSATEGITGNMEDIDRGKQMFGSNKILLKKPKSLLQLIFEALQDIRFIVLVVTALLSFGLSFYKPTGTEQPSCGTAAGCGHDERESEAVWFNGTVIVLFVTFVVTLNWMKEKPLRDLQNCTE